MRELGMHQILAVANLVSGSFFANPAKSSSNKNFSQMDLLDLCTHANVKFLFYFASGVTLLLE